MTSTSMTTPIRVFTTDEIISANRRAVSLGYNRSLSKNALDMLDPEATHICMYDIVHEQAGGKKVDPHVRALLLLKLKGLDGPTEAFVDMPWENFQEAASVVQDSDGSWKILTNVPPQGQRVNA